MRINIVTSKNAYFETREKIKWINVFILNEIKILIIFLCYSNRRFKNIFKHSIITIYYFIVNKNSHDNS